MKFLLEQSNIKLSNINEELSSEQLKEIKDYFGTTYYKNAFYLLTDGLYLNSILDNKMLEHKEISRIYNGNLIDDAKKYALKDVMLFNKRNIT